jgi:hypothetical protein
MKVLNLLEPLVCDFKNLSICMYDLYVYQYQLSIALNVVSSHVSASILQLRLAAPGSGNQQEI